MNRAVKHAFMRQFPTTLMVWGSPELTHWEVGEVAVDPLRGQVAVDVHVSAEVDR